MSEQVRWEDISTHVYEEYCDTSELAGDNDVFNYVVTCNGLVVTGYTVDHENEQIILRTGDAQ